MNCLLFDEKNCSKPSSFLRNITTKVLLIRTMLLFTILFISLGTVSGKSRREPPSAPSAVTDMIAVSENGETIVFLIDKKNKALFQARVMPETPESSKNQDPQKPLKFEYVPLDFNKNEQIDEPWALAYFQKKLYICEKDESSASVYQVDIFSSEKTKPAVKLFTKSSSPFLQEPISIAISERGVIAIGDKKSNRVILYQPEIDADGQTKYTSKALDHFYDKPRRLNFVGDDLLVFDSNKRLISLINNQASKEETPKIKELNSLIAKVKDELGEINDLRVYKGIFYIADDNDNVFAFTPSSSFDSYPIIKNPTKRGSGARDVKITASRDFLYLWNQDSPVITKIARPTPVSINFELPSELELKQRKIDLSIEDVLIKQRRALVDFYLYLEERDILSVKTVVTKRDYANIKEFLLDQNLLIERPKLIFDTIRETEYLKRLTKLICKLNQSLCNAENLINTNVPANLSIKVPSIPVEIGLTISDVNLEKKTINEHLQERVLESQLGLITPEYLLEINKQYLPSYETQIIKDNYIPTSVPNPNLKPGTFISFEGNKEQIVGSWESCLQRINSTPERNQFPMFYGLFSNNANSVVPLIELRNIGNDAVSQFDIKKVAVDFKELETETIKLSDLAAIQGQIETAVECRIPESNKDLYLIDDAIAVSGARYKFFKGNGGLRAVNEVEVASAKWLGTPATNSNYSLEINQPFYIAYKLRKVNAAKPVAEWLQVKDYQQVKTFNIQSLMGENNKTLILPATRWRLSAYVNADDFYSPQSPLYQILSMPGVKILSEESLNIVSTGMQQESVFAQNENEEECTERLKENRDKFRNSIQFRETTEKFRAVNIGIAEESVYKNHSLFSSVWLKENPSNLTELLIDESAVPDTALPCQIEPSKASNHGTHVAGLLAATGLFPNAKLFLISTSRRETASGLEDKIDKAITRNIRLFNFSFKIDGNNTANLQKVLDKMVSNKAWQESLFIAAAGNDGDDISGKLWAPVSWSHVVPNIIGVGAVDETGNVLGDWNCDVGETCEGSNYGKKYVHIVAPGKEIISTSASNGFAYATGTSQSVPLVTATAARLISSGIYNPIRVKARLIYTADWLSQYDKNKVWGGRLNFFNATTEPNKNLLKRKSDFEEHIYSLEFSHDDPKLRISNFNDCEWDDLLRDQLQPCPDEFISLKDILRIQIMSNKLYRVIYLAGFGNKRRMTILRNVMLEGKISCFESYRLNQNTNKFENDDQCQNINASGRFDFSTEIYDYIAKTPTDVTITF